MSYTPTNWQTGDTITAEKLNNMESGIAQTLVIHASFNANRTLKSVDCTPADFYAARLAGKLVEAVFVIYDGSNVVDTVKAKGPVIVGGLESFYAESTDHAQSAIYPVLSVSDDEWTAAMSDVTFPNASLCTVYAPNDFTERGKVYGFNHADTFPFWRSVNDAIYLGDALDQAISGAMLAAQSSGGKATITSALSTQEAEMIATALGGWFEDLSGGFKILVLYGSLYTGAVALTTRMHTDLGDGHFVDMQTGRFQIPVLSGSAGAYAVDTVWSFEISAYTKVEDVDSNDVTSANLVLTAEEISPTSV